jgi:hypothetical protein
MYPATVELPCPTGSALSFGIEFELRLGFISNLTHAQKNDKRKVQFADTNPDYMGTEYEISHQTIGQDISRMLSEAGVPVNTPGEPHTFSKWEVGFDNSIVDRFQQKFENSTEGGSIGKENQSTLQNGANVFWLGIELVSPAFWYSKEALEAVKEVIKLISETYIVDATHPSCGLHVHVGRGEERYTFQETKNLLAFFWQFEPQLNTLHPPHRQDIRVSLDPYSDDTALGQGCHFGSTRSLRQLPANNVVKSILEAKGWTDFTFLAGGTESLRLAYNFRGILRVEKEIRTGDPVHSLKTLEFRQHAGTLDPDAIEMWATVCVGIVDWVLSSDENSFMKLITEHGAGEDQVTQSGSGKNVIHLLKKVNLNIAAEYYE